MNAAKRGSRLIFGLILAATVAVGIASHYSRLARQADEAFALATEKHATADDRVRALETALLAAQREEAELNAALTHLKTPAATGSGPADARASTVPTSAFEPDITIAERLQKEPDTQLYFLASIRAGTAAKYGLLFRALGLPAARVERFTDIVVQRDEEKMDLAAVAQAQGFSMESAQARKLDEEIDDRFHAAQREVLGEAGYAQFKDYERTTEIRTIVNGWAGGAAVVTREPFTAQQGEQLIQILADASTSYRNGGGAWAGDVDWKQADAQAQRVLSPAQFALFQTMEPPLPTGARFQAEMYRLVNAAGKAEAKSRTRKNGE